MNPLWISAPSAEYPEIEYVVKPFGCGSKRWQRSSALSLSLFTIFC